MNTIRKYIKVWWTMTVYSAQIAFASRFGAIFFILGKLLRFSFFLLFIILLESKTKSIGGYSLWQIIFFFATYNLIDTLPQFFFREVYRFRQKVVSGEFDYTLVRPISPLFRSLFGGCDVLDAVLIVISIGLLIVSIFHLGTITPVGIVGYLLLILNSLLIATAFHIMVLGVGILTTAVDNTLWIYRDLKSIGQIPITLYLQPIKGIITYIIPVGIMMTFPPQALMGVLSIQNMIIAFVIGGIFFIASLKYWQYSLKSYTSASS